MHWKHLLKKRINILKTGPDEQDDIGAITVETSRQKILSQIDEVRNSAEVIQGSVSNDTKGWFIPPTLIVDPPSDAKITKEETFGPVITIQGFDSEIDLIKKVNSDVHIYHYSTLSYKNIRQKMDILLQMEA